MIPFIVIPEFPKTQGVKELKLCGRFIGIWSVFTSFSSSSCLRWGKKPLKPRDLAILLLIGQWTDSFKFCCTDKITMGIIHNTSCYLEMGHGSGKVISSSSCTSAFVKCFVLLKDIKKLCWLYWFWYFFKLGMTLIKFLCCKVKY